MARLVITTKKEELNGTLNHDGCHGLHNMEKANFAMKRLANHNHYYVHRTSSKRSGNAHTILRGVLFVLFVSSQNVLQWDNVAHAAFVANAGCQQNANSASTKQNNSMFGRSMNNLHQPSYQNVQENNQTPVSSSFLLNTLMSSRGMNDESIRSSSSSTRSSSSTTTNTLDNDHNDDTMLSGCEYYEDEYCHDPELVKNHAYINTLEKNLRTLLDKWIMSGRPDLQEQAQGILTQVRRNALEEEQISRVERLMRRAGMVYGPRSTSVEERLLKQQKQQQSMKRATTNGNHGDSNATRRNGSNSPTNNSFPRVPVETGHDVTENRKSFAKARQEWESSFQQKASSSTKTDGKSMAKSVVDNLSTARSALSSRASSTASEKATNFVDSLKNVDDASKFIRDHTYQENSRQQDDGQRSRGSSIETQQFGPQTDDQWNRMYAMLTKYYRDHGHCNVPFKYPAYPKLGIWVELQREQYHCRHHGELTPRQIDLLNTIQFDWQVDDDDDFTENVSDAPEQLAEQLTSDLVAKAGAGDAFEGPQLGIGGLEDVLKEIKRRIWVPLAAPPSLLNELGISPVRGLLLYGQPGCGKTLLARKLGGILSPARPITVVSGPELMEKFVGQSEANLRAVFDNPPNVYDELKTEDEQYYDALNKAALHVVVLDEFDAMARARGGKGGTGDNQGDAGVARDSVVNQLLAKMDGVDALSVPTLVIGMTNQRKLIEPALLRPGRFEVQIEVPPPRTVEQRVSILRVHTQQMYDAGRLLVKDAPSQKKQSSDGSSLDSSVTTTTTTTTTAASRRINALMEHQQHLETEKQQEEELLTYEQLLQHLAEQTTDYSGAMLAGVARAAASHALERAVCEFAGTTLGDSNTNTSSKQVNGSSTANHHPSYGRTIADCLVTKDDLEMAIQDVRDSNPILQRQQEQQDNNSTDDNEDDKKVLSPGNEDMKEVK